MTPDYNSQEFKGYLTEYLAKALAVAGKVVNVRYSTNSKVWSVELSRSLGHRLGIECVTIDPDQFSLVYYMWGKSKQTEEVEFRKFIKEHLNPYMTDESATEDLFEERS